MSAWEITLIVLGIINILAFLSSIWAAYKAWETERRKEWGFLLMGLFFIPICIFIAFAWPIAKLRELRKEEQQKKEQEKQREKSKRYHFQKFSIRLKGLPYEPTIQEIIYVENGYNERINQIIKDNVEYIQKCLDGSKYFPSTFVYLPNLIEELSHDEAAIGYYAPFIKDRNISTEVKLSSNMLLDYMAAPENRGKIVPCFARYQGEESGCSIFECVGFEPEPDINAKEFIELLCSTFDHYPYMTGPRYQTANKSDDEVERSNIDVRFDKHYKQLMEEVEERILKLRKMGISQWALEQLIKPDLTLSRLVITKDFRLLLPDYNNMEIKMEPLAKAVYLLFLKHPEGILFKCLPDYRKELTEIYTKLRPMGLTDRALQSIEDVTNPLLNSINEKCARIRGAFIGHFDERLAQHYYIYGSRGEAKKITLPRNLVVWE